jgi:hypothetical protein
MVKFDHPSASRLLDSSFSPLPGPPWPLRGARRRRATHPSGARGSAGGWGAGAPHIRVHARHCGKLPSHLLPPFQWGSAGGVAALPAQTAGPFSSAPARGPRRVGLKRARAGPPEGRNAVWSWQVRGLARLGSGRFGVWQVWEVWGLAGSGFMKCGVRQVWGQASLGVGQVWGLASLGFGKPGVWEVWSLGSVGFGKLGVWEVWGLGSLEFGKFGVWQVWGFGSLEFGKLGVWEVGGLGSLVFVTMGWSYPLSAETVLDAFRFNENYYTNE